MAIDFSEELKHLRATMDSVREVTGLDALAAQITELEAQASVPNLWDDPEACLLYTSPSPRDRTRSRMPSSA